MFGTVATVAAAGAFSGAGGSATTRDEDEPAETPESARSAANIRSTVQYSRASACSANDRTRTTLWPRSGSTGPLFSTAYVTGTTPNANDNTTTAPAAHLDTFHAIRAF